MFEIYFSTMSAIYGEIAFELGSQKFKTIFFIYVGKCMASYKEKNIS